MCISVTLTVESMKKLSLAFQHNSACSVDSVCPPLISIVLFSIKIIHYSFMYFSWLNRLSFFFRDTFISLLKLLIGIFGNVCLFPIILMHSASLKSILYKYYHKKQLFNLICNPLLLVTSARPPPTKPIWDWLLSKKLKQNIAETELASLFYQVFIVQTPLMDTNP